MKNTVFFCFLFLFGISAFLTADNLRLIDREIPELHVNEPIRHPGSYLYGIASDQSNIYCVDYETDRIYRVNGDRTTEVSSLDISYCRGMAYFQDQFYILASGRLYTLEPETGRTEEIGSLRVTQESRPTGIAVDSEYFYISDQADAQLRVYDRNSLDIVSTWQLQENPRGIILYNGLVWVLYSQGAIVRGYHPETGRQEARFLAPRVNGLRGITIHNNTWFFGSHSQSRIISTTVEFGEDYIRSNPHRVVIRMNNIVRNNYPGPLSWLEVRVIRPRITDRQEIYFLEAPEPTRIAEDPFGNPVMFYNFENFASGKHERFGFLAIADLWDIQYQVENFGFNAYQSLPEGFYREFTEDHENLGMDTPIIREAVAQIRKVESSVPETVLNIRDYVLDHVSYIDDGAWARAPDVLSRGTGSCSEYSSVFSAIARSFGIPTRYAFGTLFSADDEEAMTYRDEHFHRWVEVYIPDIGWVPVDTNREDRQNGEYRQNLVFGYDWKVLQHSARFSDDGSFLGTNMMLLHRWSRGRNSAESGDVFRSHWAEWEIMNRY